MAGLYRAWRTGCFVTSSGLAPHLGDVQDYIQLGVWSSNRLPLVGKRILLKKSIFTNRLNYCLNVVAMTLRYAPTVEAKAI